jgi:hypothetical protein
MKISRRRRYTKRVKHNKRLKKTYRKTNVRRIIKTHHKRILRGGVPTVIPTESGFSIRDITPSMLGRFGRLSDEPVVEMKFRKVNKIGRKKFFQLYTDGKFKVSLTENQDKKSYKVTLLLDEDENENISFSFNIEFMYQDDNYITFTISYNCVYPPMFVKHIFRVRYKSIDKSIDILPGTVEFKRTAIDEFKRTAIDGTFVNGFVQKYNPPVTWESLSDGYYTYFVDDESVVQPVGNELLLNIRPDNESPDEKLNYFGYAFKIDDVFYLLIKFVARNAPSSSKMYESYASNMQEVDG